MSRIEEALERAMRIKEGEARKMPVPQPQAVPADDVGENAAPYGSPGDVRGYPAAAPDRVRIQNPALVAITDPTSPVAEEYRKLKEMVLKATRTTEGFRNMLMVTSALAGEGKSVTSLNLAACLAQEYDHTVLVVDADLRKPSCAKYLGIEPGQGITDCLLKGTPFNEALIHTGIGKLAFLPAGSPVDNPAELFSSHRMRDLLMEMKHRYPDRYIVIDTPPVLPFAETRSIGAIADGVILVVKEGVPSQEEIRESVDALRGATILGIVYNQADLSGINKPYSNYYYDRYRR
jgi:protein-tyrosine kinase